MLFDIFVDLIESIFESKDEDGERDQDSNDPKPDMGFGGGTAGGGY